MRESGIIIGHVLQEEPRPTSEALYTRSSPPKTVIVLERDVIELLRTKAKKTILSSSNKGRLVGKGLAEEEVPTYLWARMVRENDFVSIGYPHYLNPKDASKLTSELGNRLSSNRVDHTVITKAQKEIIRTWGLEVPPPIVEELGLREGFEVQITVLTDYQKQGNNIIVITHVNGISCQDLKKIQEYPNPEGTTSPQTSYPQELIPLDKYGSLAWRMLYLLGAVQGYGQTTYISGEGGLGKTTISLEAWEAVLRLTTENPKVYALLVFIGERKEDLDDYLDVMSKTPHVKDRVEIISAPKGTEPKHQWQVFEYAYHRSITLGMQYHLITFYESASRAVDSYRAVADPNGGMVTGGIPTEAITKVASMIGLGGYYPQLGTSNTNIVITLDGNKAADPLIQFTLMTREHNSTSRVQLVASTMIDFPKISVISLETGTRRRERFTPEALKKEQEFVMQIASRSIIGDGSTVKPEILYARLRAYARDNPEPAYVSGRTFEVGTSETQWERLVRLSEHLKIPIGEIYSMAGALLLEALARQNMSHGTVAVLDSKGDPIEIIQLPKGAGEGIKIVKSNDPKFAQILGAGNVSTQRKSFVPGNGDNTIEIMPDQIGVQSPIPEIVIPVVVEDNTQFTGQIATFDSLWATFYKKVGIFKIWTGGDRSLNGATVEDLRKLYDNYGLAPEDILGMIDSGKTKAQILSQYPLEVSND